MIEETNKKNLNTEDNKFAKDEDLKKIALKIMKKFEKTFEVLAK